MADLDLPVWSFEPNWQAAVLETLEFKTDILTSDAGTEQRRELRLSPRRMLEYSVAVYGPERTRFDLAVVAIGGSECLLPLWQNISRLRAPLGAGARTALADTRGREYRVGDLAILYADAFTFYVGEVLSVFDDQVEFAHSSGRAWPAGTAIYPIRKARFTEQPKPGRMNDKVYSGNVRFQITTANDLPANFYARVDETFRNRTVITAPPNEQSKLDYQYSRFMEELDNDFGIPYTVDTANESFPMQQYAWALYGRDERSSFRSLMYSLAGRQHSCWLPTFASDLELTSSAEIGDISLEVRNCGYTDFASELGVRRFVRVGFTDGSGVCLQIIASAYADETKATEVLTLAAPIPAAIDRSRVSQISFLTFCRLDQDAIEISHVTDIDGVATCQVVFKALSPSELDVGVGTGFGYNFGEDFGVSIG